MSVCLPLVMITMTDPRVSEASLSIFLFCVHTCVHMFVCGQKTTCGSKFSPSALWVPRTGLRPSVLVASAITTEPPA